MDRKPPRSPDAARPGKAVREPVRQPARLPGRQPGRPAGNIDRRALALDAALHCYVHRGIAATTLRDIATQAGVTPAALHYYFEDTAGLRDAVIAERLMPVFEQVRGGLIGMPDASLGQVLEGFIDHLCALVQEHPWLSALWIREVVSEGGSLRGLLVERMAPEITRILTARIAGEQAAGRLNSGLDPRLLMVSLVGLTLFPAAGLPIWQQLFPGQALEIDHIRTHALALVGRGLELVE